MNETEFYALVDKTLTKVEEIIDRSGEDVDFETAEGILTLTFENGSKIIINRQTPIKQLWLAAKHGGFHFNYENNQWVCDKTGKTLADVLQHAFHQQAGIQLEFGE